MEIEDGGTKRVALVESVTRVRMEREGGDGGNNEENDSGDFETPDEENFNTDSCT